MVVVCLYCCAVSGQGPGSLGQGMSEASSGNVCLPSAHGLTLGAYAAIKGQLRK